MDFQDFPMILLRGAEATLAAGKARVLGLKREVARCLRALSFDG